MDFEFDFGTMTSAAPQASSGPLYASIDGMTAQISPEECVFQVRGTDQVHVMTLDVLRAMSVMRRFATLDQQVARIEEAIPQLKGRRDAIDPVVKFLIDRGLVVMADALIGDANEEPAAAQAPVVAIRTCGRPAALERLLESLPPGGRVLVIDDSRDDGVVSANRAVVDRFAGATHLDRAWRSRLMDHLVAAGCDESGMRTLLLPEGNGFAGGAAFNALLLLTAGERPIILDDDMIWTLAASPDDGAGIVRLSATTEAPITLLQEDDSAWEPSPFAWYERLPLACGQPLAIAAGELDLDLDLDSLADQSFAAASRLLDDATVKTVQFGYAGDAGMDTRVWLYLMDSEAASAWWADKSTYFGQLERPRVQHCHRRPQVSDISNFTVSALDNTELTPPTVPTERGEDVVFNAFLRFLHPQGLNLHLPVAIAHERDGGRPGENPDAFAPWVSRFFAEYALAHLDECDAADPAARLAHLAQRFDDIAAAT
ncbi:MAG: hypothetical protein AAGE01_24360, partial [Pseudomonadota bacterium]